MTVDDDPFEQQRRLYGATVGDLLRRITGRVGLSQAGVARVLGLSPAMLSQLATGQRVKIGNPLVLGRLQALHELSGTDPLPAGAELQARLDRISASTDTITTPALPQVPAGSEAVRRLLRAVASGRDLERAAETLDASFPELAAVLRTYGTGPAAEAEKHFRSVSHLMA